MSVAEAAKLIGISRPRLSNFLNENVSASTDMAARLERTFGISAEEILALQMAYDAGAGRRSTAAESATPYVPAFLGVKANDIIAWLSGQNIDARAKFAVLLRKLVHSTAHGLTSVDFPGNDDSQRAGWDGYIESTSGTPWIPSGKSGWEFGVTKDVARKAKSDFFKSVKAVSSAERAQITFVFVTPQRWTNKTAWVKKMRSGKEWKDIRVYDASDLEQWIEQSLAAQTWFANEMAIDSRGVRTLDRCWHDWADVAASPLPASLFASAKERWRSKLIDFLKNTSSRPLVVTADSREEALAFVSQAMRAPDLERYRDKVLVFDKPGPLKEFAQATTDFIAVTHNRDVEQELAPYASSLKSIVLYPRNASIEQVDIALDILDDRSFEKALVEIGSSREEVRRLARETGRSATVLRRRLSEIPAIRTPAWAGDEQKARRLIPFMLLGTWDSQRHAEQQILSILSGGTPYESLEEDFLTLLRMNDSPVWSIGPMCGVVSKLDSLISISQFISNSDLRRFLITAKLILEGLDPATEMSAKGQNEAAAPVMPNRYAQKVRESIIETLILLSIHSETHLETHIGFDVALEASNIVREVLSPIDMEKLEIYSQELRLYSELAPDEYLDVIERDLESLDPCLVQMMQRKYTAFIGTHPRVGVLWSLECLAWCPERYMRVIKILAQLYQLEPHDNLSNRSTETLNSLIRVFKPQTHASVDARRAAIRMLVDKYPDVGWRVCIQEMTPRGSMLYIANYKPKWRPVVGRGTDMDEEEEAYIILNEMRELVLSRLLYTTEMVYDLVEIVVAFHIEDQLKVWRIVEDYIHADISGEHLTELRRRIRKCLSLMRSLKDDREGLERSLRAGQSIYDDMASKDPYIKYEWMFQEGALADRENELGAVDLDFSTRIKMLDELQAQALGEIFHHAGTEGIIDCASRGWDNYQIGLCASVSVLSIREICNLIFDLSKLSDQFVERHKSLLVGLLSGLIDERRRDVFVRLKSVLSKSDVLSLILIAPYRKGTWQIVDEHLAEMQRDYWAEVVPRCPPVSSLELNESVRRLIDGGRPVAAFHCAQYKLEEVCSDLLVELMREVGRDAGAAHEPYTPDSHFIRHALQLIDADSSLSLEEKCELEIASLDALEHTFSRYSQYQMPNTERYLEEQPEMFVRFIMWAYGGRLANEDLAEQHGHGDRGRLESRGFRLLGLISRIPGEDEPTPERRREKLADWVASVRKLSREVELADAADECIGELLAKAPEGSDGVWPNESVRDVIEELGVARIAERMVYGRLSARGLVIRGKGGEQERELENRYRRWAKALEYSHPLVASRLLTPIANRYGRDAKMWDTEADVRRRLDD